MNGVLVDSFRYVLVSSFYSFVFAMNLKENPNGDSGRLIGINLAEAR